MMMAMEGSTMSISHPLLFMLMTMIIISMAREAASLEAAQPPANCTRSCGGIQVPYPFGLDDLGEDCYLSGDFNLTCNMSFSPPKLFSGDFEVIDIMLPSGHMRVLMDISYDCYNSSDYDAGTSTWNVSLDSFMLSHTENVFTAVGCETQARFNIGRDNYGGCMTGCNSLNSVVDGQCNGIGCCQSSIPEEVDRYETNFTYRDNASTIYRFNNCSYFFVVEKNNYTFNKSHLAFMDWSSVFPIILDWHIGTESCEEATKSKTRYACVSSNSVCSNSTNGRGYICNCYKGYVGNPYLEDGCKDIDECKLDRIQYPCHGICANTEGGYNCTCRDGSSSIDPKKERCIFSLKEIVHKNIPLALIVSIGIIGGLLLLLVIILICCVGYQRRKNTKLKEKFFVKNGGTFIEQALSSNRYNTFQIFTEDELEKATKNFNKDRILGQGGSGEVYKGILEDKSVIAVKRSTAVDEKGGQDFANEVLILSKVNHNNIVKLLGCCLQSKIPMLVYEYIPNDTLHNYIHNKRHQLLISFRTRLRIAVEAAGALKYLHMDASPPICHGDVKSSNILLDEGHVAKVSDFGTSILAPKDKSEFKTLVQGTYGYLDPEYILTGYLTYMSDVYSFGVVLAELLTGKLPFNFKADGKEKSLANNFLSCVNENKVEEILDPQIIAEGPSSAVMKVVHIISRCLSMKGKERPTMKEVLIELQEELRVHGEHPWETCYLEEADGLLGETSSYKHDISIETHAILHIEGAR